MSTISKVYLISDDEFKDLVKQSYCYSDILRALGLNTSGGSSRDTLKRRIQELNCSTEHFNRNINNPPPSPKNKKSLEEILVFNSTYTNTSALKRRLIKEEKLNYCCAMCGISEWNNKFISLQLHHINGDNSDNRLENLELLCPNCHSQTDTYAGKNS